MTSLIDSSSVRATVVDIGRRWLGPRQLNHLVRFEPVLALVLAARDGGGSLLDVGSGSRGISTLMPTGWQATAVDNTFDDYAPRNAPSRLGTDQQVGDVRALPFGDRSFDVTVAVDLLEHVAPEDRVQAIREICRVSRLRAVIACPVGDEALDADRRLASRLEGERREIPQWLTEHLQNGFPQSGDIADAAKPYGATRIIGNESIDAHERLVVAEQRIVPALLLRLGCRPLERLLTSRRRWARSIAVLILQWVRGNDRAPTYRGIIVVDRDPVA